MNMREFCDHLKALGRAAAEDGFDPKRARHLLMHETRSAASASYAYREGYLPARAALQLVA
ncbi:MAG: hypothetical protein MUE52_00355 [Tabrizicola sp.]|jgi:hypothetical protein|nr:hypothetical protein [Tabrizicola sp.]